MNKSGLYVERAIEDHDFVELGFVEGHGTTNERQTYSFRTIELDPGFHTFRLRQVDYDGTTDYSSEVEVMIEIPGDYVLFPAYPNPFNPSTEIRFAVKESKPVTLELFDILGRPHRLLYEGTPEKNRTVTVRVDAENLPTGMYIVRLIGEDFSAAQRITLLR